jgi:hypothetical protein
MIPSICFNSLVNKAMSSFSSREYSSETDISCLIDSDGATSIGASMHTLVSELIDRYSDHSVSEFNAPRAFYATLLLDVSGSMDRLRDNSTLRSLVVTVANKVNSAIVDFDKIMGDDFLDHPRIVADVLTIYHKWIFDIHRANVLIEKMKRERKLSYGEFSTEVVKRVVYGLSLVDILLAPLQKFAAQNPPIMIDVTPLMKFRIEYLELVKKTLADQSLNPLLAGKMKEIVAVEHQVVKHLLVAYQDILRVIIPR